MSPIRSQAAIRFVVALFLAQTFVNAVAVPHPHIHQVLDPRQVVSLPVVARQESVEPEAKNVFDAIIDTLKGYNGWQVFQDFFRKLFNSSPPEDNEDDNGDYDVPPIVVVPGPDASESPVDVISVIESIISEVTSPTEPIVVIPSPTDAPTSSESDGIMSILPIWPITTAIELFPTEEPSIPTELLSEALPETTESPEATDLPIVVVVPPVEVNSTDAGIALPTEVLPPVGTAPIVTDPIVVVPVATETPLFPIENGTVVAPLPGTDVPVIIIIPTGISSPLELNASASAEVSASVDVGAEINATVSLTSTIDLTVTIEPTLIGTDVPSVGTALPIAISEDAPFANATAIVPTLVLVTGTGDVVGTILPTLAVEPISAPFANSSDAATAVAPIGTGVIIGTDILPPLGTAVVSIEPVETLVLGTGIIGTGTDEATAVAPIGTDLPLFPNATAVEIVVEPTLVLPTGTGLISAVPLPSEISEPTFPNTTAVEIVVEPTVVLPIGTGPISAVPLPSEISEPLFANTTTTTVTNIITPSVILGTGVETAVAPAGTIVVVPGPDVVFPNITITVNSSDVTLPVTLPVVTDLPVEATDVPEVTIDITSLAPIAPVGTEFPAIPIETVLPIVPIETDLPAIPAENVTAIGPIVDPIPTDAPVVEFPGLLALRSICRDPTVRQLTLPILNRFYGPSAYPSLFSFPGCLPANARQSIQAPGLLNCTSLGTEVQTCQASGRRVLLSVKADGLASVGGNANFGDPNSDAAPWGGYFANGSVPVGVFFPNLFDERHVPSAFALTLFSLFGEGTTERADLRPLGPDTPPEDGISWVTRPLGEEVVVDGFDVQVPRDWEGTYQEGKFDDLVTRLGELNDEAWTASGARRGGPGDLGVDGKGVVFRGWNKKRAVQRVVMVGGFEVLVE